MPRSRAYRAAAWDRDDLVADPAKAPVDPEQLLDPVRLADRLEAIAPDRVADWPSNRKLPAGTAYLCAVDRNGTGVSFIQSNFMGIGSGIGAGEAGFFLHNRAGFDLRPAHPTSWLPACGRSTPCRQPLDRCRGRLAMLLGTRGGHHQPQLLIQMAAHLLFGRHVSRRGATPRWEIGPAGFGSATSLGVEPSTPADVVEGLRRRGHDVEVAGESQPGWGPVSVITVDGEGVRTAAADPRVATANAVVS